MSGTVSGLKPGLHGFHVHALGDTTNGCMSTGNSYAYLSANFQWIRNFWSLYLCFVLGTLIIAKSN